MHVILVWRAFTWGPSRSGVTSYIQNIAGALSGIGCRVTIVRAGRQREQQGCPDQVSEIRVETRPIWGLKTARYGLSRLGLRNLSLWLGLLASEAPLERWLKNKSEDEPYDIAVFCDTTVPEGWLYSKHATTPFLLSLRGGSYTRVRFSPERTTSWERAWAQARNREMARRSPFIYCPSKALAQAAEAEFGLPSESISVIPNPVDVELWTPGSAGSPRDNTARILFVGRFSPEKGLDTLLDAIPLVLHEVRHGLWFTFVGANPSHACSQACCCRIRSLFNDLGVPDRLDLRMSLRREELLGVYRAASVCVVPSLWETCSNVILEAMACGVPVVATRAGGTPEIIEHGRTGWLVEPGNPKQLAEAIIHVLKNAQEAREVAMRGREHVLREYTVDKIARQTLAFYEECISRWGSGVRTRA
ncbi:MAG TPA: glycosyltransferase family 4 protein [bacterium]|nr:glycosyltransferase family 4 protein [bacterium]